MTDKLAAAENALAQSQAERIDRLENCFICIECGRGKADEDGCCTTCGRDCLVFIDGKLMNTGIADYTDAIERKGNQFATVTADRDALQSKLARALSEYDRMNAALQRDPDGQDWLAMRDCLRESEKQLAECRTELNAKIGTLQAQLTVERANHGNTRDALAEACDKAEAYADHPTLDVHVRARIDALRKAGGL